MKRIMRWVVIASVIAGVILTYLISQATSGAEGFAAKFTANYTYLLAGVGLIAASLLTVIIYQLALLLRRVRASEFGSRLALKLTIALGLMALVPGVLLYAVSYQFIERSVDNFFDVRIEQALDSGLKLGIEAVTASGKSLAGRLEMMSKAFASERARSLDNTPTLESLRNNLRCDALAYFDANGQWVEEAGEPNLIGREALSPSIRSAANLEPQISNDQQSERAIVVRAILATDNGADKPVTYLMAAERLSVGLGRDAERITTASNDYRQLALIRGDIKRVFALALSLALLITLFSAIALSFVLSQTITAPLSALAEATRAVARGDYTRLNPVLSRDEFGILTQSFNTMTRRIADATETMLQNQLQVENARAYLATILANLQTGVLTFDSAQKLRTVNDAACVILGEDLYPMIGQAYDQWPATAAWQAIKETLNTPLTRSTLPRAKIDPSTHWERQAKLKRIDGERNLILRCTRITTREATPSDESVSNRVLTLPIAVRSEEGYILVFDDITRVVEGEREAAWAEVARRLAHEIKNPLTPIQLSAQRLAAKLQAKLSPDDAQMLVRGTDTIVNQVTVLKSMVDDFSMYARASRIQFVEVSLNNLVQDVLSLYEAMPVEIVRNLEDSLPQIQADPTMVRQVLHNLMQNSLDALNGNTSATVNVNTTLSPIQGKITISTSQLNRKDEAFVALEVTDNGPGVESAVLQRVFEPYVTTKAKGTGLGLAIVKRIVEEHHGEVRLENQNGGGARVLILLPVLGALSRLSLQPINAVT